MSLFSTFREREGLEDIPYAKPTVEKSRKGFMPDSTASPREKTIGREGDT